MPNDGQGSGYRLEDVPAGKIAAIVTHLQMFARPERPAPVRIPPGTAVRRVADPDLDWYRGIYRAVGQEWLWYTRLAWDDARLARVIRDPGVEIYALTQNGDDKGLLELDFRFWPDVELLFFGVVAEAIGNGAAHLLMHHALERAWRDGPRRFWVHTCTLDHPRALSFYERTGFVAYRREVEIDDDPRITGILPRDAASWYPIIE